LQPASGRAVHQNLSGKTRATNRKTVSKKPPIRPIQFSALKVLNPLHDEDEYGEDDDRHADAKQVQHGLLLWSKWWCGSRKPLFSTVQVGV
jgi:hypothetical protein